MLSSDASSPGPILPDPSLRGRLVLFLKGMAMGVADSVPGVSGGTIAVISGIYETLIHALRRCNPMALRVLVQQGPREFWKQIHGGFLLTLGGGILLSLILMANAVLYLLAEHFVLVMAFFMGLVLASCWMLRRETGRWDLVNVLLFVAGFAVTTSSFLLNPAVGSSSLLYVFVCGMIAICAMILPGISGAFILILLGAYEQVLDALRSVQMDIVLVFALGCAVGLLSFAHFLGWLFYYYRQRTYAFLVGMLAASLIVLWPWRQLQESGRGVPVWPEQYLALTGEPSRVLMVLFCAALGAVVILTFAHLTRREHGA